MAVAAWAVDVVVHLFRAALVVFDWCSSHWVGGGENSLCGCQVSVVGEGGRPDEVGRVFHPQSAPLVGRGEDIRAAAAADGGHW